MSSRILGRSAIRLFFLIFVLSCIGVTVGCGSKETTVIDPGEPYQLTEQEQKNRDREVKALAEQRQQ